MLDGLILSSRLTSDPLVGGDVRVTGEIMNLLTLQLEWQLLALGEGEGLQAVGGLAELASNLLNPALSSAWVGVVEGVEFDSEDLLSSLEALSRLLGNSLVSATPSSLIQENLLIRTAMLQSRDLSHNPFTLILNDSTATVALETAANGSLLVTFGLYPVLGDLLPMRTSFDIGNFSVATPILSIQVADAEGSEVTQVSVTMTLHYNRPLTQHDVVGGAVCVAWGYETR